MITEEKYLEAKKIVDDYETGVIKSLPSDSEIHQYSLERARIESDLIYAVAWHYHDLGAKWMKQEAIKRGNVL